MKIEVDLDGDAREWNWDIVGQEHAYQTISRFSVRSRTIIIKVHLV
jgi:hypothetical protein